MAVLRLITRSYLVGCLHRQVGWLLALEDAIDVAGGAPVLVEKIGPIGNQAAAVDEEAFDSRPRAACAGPQAR